MDSGLEGVIAGGARRRARLRGAVAVLWEGFVGNALTRDGIRAALGAQEKPPLRVSANGCISRARRPPDEGLRLALARLPEDSRPAAILASLPVAVAALIRMRHGAAPLPPYPGLGSAADLLRMIPR